MKGEIDIQGLDELFEKDYKRHHGDEVEKKDIFQIDFPDDSEIDYDDPTSIIKNNIKKANAVLDMIQEEMNRGNFSARLAEVAGNILNSITAASKEIISDKNYKGYLTIRAELVKLKEREVEIKENKGKKPTSQNIIVTSREDLLKIMDGKTPKGKVIEHKSDD